MTDRPTNQPTERLKDLWGKLHFQSCIECILKCNPLLMKYPEARYNPWPFWSEKMLWTPCGHHDETLDNICETLGIITAPETTMIKWYVLCDLVKAFKGSNIILLYVYSLSSWFPKRAGSNTSMLLSEHLVCFNSDHYSQFLRSFVCYCCKCTLCSSWRL